MTELRHDRTSILASLLTACGLLLSACGGSNGGDTKGTTTQVGSNRTAEASLAAENSPDAAATAWSFCSSEQGMCNFSGTRQVRYGSGGLYKYATYDGGVRCTSSVFGDPVPGKVKACSVSVAKTGDSDTPTAPQTRPSTQSGNITLAWIAPQTNADGSPLTDLAGYRVRYGTNSGSYSNTIELPDPHALNHVLKGLPADDYYLIVTAYNSANVESLASAEVRKSIK